MFFIFDSSPFILPFLSHSKGASALNQAAPSNAFELANHYYDAMDPALSLPDHNGGKAACTGGPSCASLCAGTSFYQTMKATMLSFWRTTKLSAVDQDGSRYDASYGPIRPSWTKLQFTRPHHPIGVLSCSVASYLMCTC